MDIYENYFLVTELVGTQTVYYISEQWADLFWFASTAFFIFLMTWSIVGIVKLFSLRV